MTNAERITEYWAEIGDARRKVIRPMLEALLADILFCATMTADLQKKALLLAAAFQVEDLLSRVTALGEVEYWRRVEAALSTADHWSERARKARADLELRATAAWVR